MTDPLKAYQQHLVQPDSLPDVFIQAYDSLSSLLYSAALAVDARDIEKKTAEIDRALTMLLHLQSALDFERGGEIAPTLNRFYQLLRRDIIQGSVELDAGMLRQAAAHVLEIRGIWEQALALNQPGPSQTAKTPPPPEVRRGGFGATVPFDALSQDPPPSSNHWTA